MKKVCFIFLLLNLFIIINSYATVNFLAVNHFTKEYYWKEEGDIALGWIGWDYIPEGELDIAEMKLLSLGYQRTDFPFKIEVISVLPVCILFIIGLIRLKSKKVHSKS